MKEEQDITVKFNKELRKLISDYNENTGVAVEDIRISWMDIMGGEYELNEIQMLSKTYGVK
jgi:hypothetical protein